MEKQIGIYFVVVLYKLKEKNIKPEILDKILVSHLVDELLFDDKLLLINYIENKKLSNSLNELEKLIDEYFESITLTNKSITGIFLDNKLKNILIVKKIQNGY